MQHASSRLSPRTSRRHVTLVLLVVALALSGLPAPPVSADTLVVTETDDSGAGSLRQAIADSAPGDTIVFHEDLSGGTILPLSTLALPHSLTIDASALDAPVTLDAQMDRRVLEVAVGADVTLRGLTIINGRHADKAGAILNRGTLTVAECTFSGNTAVGEVGLTALGGAIANYGSLTVTDSTFANNSVGSIFPGVVVPGRGGAIYSAPGASLAVTGSVLTENGAIGAGGALHSLGTLDVQGTAFTRNGAFEGSGGAIYHAGAGPATLSDCALADNISGAAFGSGGLGGAIHSEGPLTVSGSTLSGNSATMGGGIANGLAGTLQVTASTFLTNTASNTGGGIYSVGTLVAEDCVWEANTATASGGGLAAVVTPSDAAPLQVTRCSFAGNAAAFGGGVYHEGHLLLATGSTFALNSADMGGALATLGLAMVRESTFVHNNAAAGGGAVVAGSQLTVTNSTFSANATDGSGGALLAIPASGLVVTYSTLVDNSATTGGGALATQSLAHVANSILRSTPTQGGACVASGGGTISGAYNLASDATCGAASTDDPLLAALADNGGPTETFALLEGSPAVNAGDPDTCPPTDQRGVARPQGAGCDIGAFEAAAPAVRTDPAGGVTASAATLWGTVTPRGWATTAAFEVGDTTAYGTTLSVGSLPVTVTGEISVSYVLTGLAPHTTYHYRAVAENAIAPAHGEDGTFTTEAIAPAATTLPAAGATVHATVNAHNDDATVTFAYGPTSAYGATAPATPGTVAGMGETPVSAALTGLLPNTLYHYRVVATNSAGTTHGEDLTFTAPRAAPLAITDPAEDVATDGATLRGRVTAQNEATAVRFQYGLSTAYGTTVSAAPPTVTGLDETPVALAIAGLQPNETYHYRVVAVNGSGTTVGEDLTFTTLPVPPTATTRPARGVGTTGAVLEGLVNAHGAEAEAWFVVVALGGDPVTVAAAPSPVTGRADTAVSATVEGLAPNTTYHYRVVAENAAGETAGEEATFTTSRVEHTLALPLLRR